MAVQNLVGNVGYRNVSQCALVLENNPVGADSRLVFESFPADGFEESYGVSGYRDIGASRMPQPGFVAYQGGNWTGFSLELKFRAEGVLNTEKKLEQLSTSDLEAILTAMERKARWCQALCFPLERKAANFARRIQRASQSGLSIDANQIQRIASQTKRNDPPFVLVVFGTFLVLRCYATGYSIRWEHPFHPITAQPFGCTVTLQLQRIDENYPDWQSVRNAAGSLPQSPFVPSIPGNVLIRSTAARAAQRALAQGNAGAVSTLVNLTDPSASISVR